MRSGVAVTAWPKSCRRAMVAFVAPLRLNRRDSAVGTLSFSDAQALSIRAIVVAKKLYLNRLCGAFAEVETFQD